MTAVRKQRLVVKTHKYTPHNPVKDDQTSVALVIIIINNTLTVTKHVISNTASGNLNNDQHFINIRASKQSWRSQALKVSSLMFIKATSDFKNNYEEIITIMKNI